MEYKRGQLSIEFFILVGAMFFFFVIFLFAVQQNIASRSVEKIRIDVRENALAVQDEINLALKSSEGYQRTFVVPEKISGKDYSISLISGSVYIVTNDEKYSISLPIGNVTGNIIIGNNTIRKENGEVVLNK